MNKVTAENLDGRLVWRKRYGVENRRLAKYLLRTLCRWLGISSLLPVPDVSPAQQCRTEFERIEQLRALGVRVPQVERVSDVELLLEDMGSTLSYLCSATDDVLQRCRIIEQGFAAIADLHRRGGNVSQAFARNMVFADGLVGFIDHEEDPLQVMAPVQAQARDVLFYVSSTARFLSHHPELFRSLLQAHLDQQSPAVRSEVARTAGRLAWAEFPFRISGKRGRALSVALVQLRGLCATVLAAFDGLPYATVQTLLV